MAPPVLVVEDDRATIRLIQEAFAEIDPTVTCVIATDGVEAFDYIHGRDRYAGTPRPSLVLLDLGLPGKSGQEILAEIHADSLLQGVPIVVFSSTDDPATIAECYAEGATAYIVKPESYDEIVTKLRTLIDFWMETVEHPPAP